MEERFAGFIITYNRPVKLTETIEKVLSQTYSPEKLWIIDNSDNEDTERKINTLTYENVIYHKVGYNAGPAGAAKIGLCLAAEEGVDWIYWGDDDDPPVFPNVFERLFNIIRLESASYKIGQIGIVGQYFDEKRGLLVRISDKQLKNSKTLPVDNIAGNQCKLINARVVTMGIYPDEELFFGFEELSFDVKLKIAGFQSVIDGSFQYTLREKYGKLGFKKGVVRKRNVNSLWRNYYSTRNLLYILKDNGYYTAVVYQIIRRLLKIGVAYRYGRKYGHYNMQTTLVGISHFLVGRKGENKHIGYGRK